MFNLQLKNNKNMKESFEQLFKSFTKKNKIRPGSIINATVIDINKSIVFVDAGLKSESAIPINQFLTSKGELEIKIGSIVDVVLETIENGFGETVLSREKAKRFYTWKMLEKAYEDMSTIEGKISGKVKGGFTVELDGIRAFLPGSLVDIRPIRDSLYLEGKTFEFKVIKLDQKKNNVVVSRRAVIQSINNNRENFLESLKEGTKIKGIVKNLTDYGAFIDLGGIDGLLHITDISWKRIKHPKEIINISDEITVQILNFDKEKNRVSLGLKQLSEDPWKDIGIKYKEGIKLYGKVTNITDYGCFIEIEDGIEGLVHISEMDWINKNIHPSKIVKIGDTIEVMILNIDKDRRRISLGMKQCKNNPWKEFEKKHSKGDHIKGKIKSITDFGIFVGLEGNIDGLIHSSDISWNISEEKEISNYKKGDEILTVILQIDSERERVSLGIKQLHEDPFNKFISSNKKGTIFSGKVLRISEKNIFIKISDEIEGCLNIENLPEDDDLKNNFLKIGNIVKVKLFNFDKKNRVISLNCFFDKQNEKKFSENRPQDDYKKEKDISNTMTEAFKTATKID